MTKAFLGSLVLQAMGIYSLIQAIGRIGDVIQGLSMSGSLQDQEYWFLGAGISFLLLLGLSGILLIFARKLSREPETREKGSTSFQDVPIEEFHTMALSVIGILVFILALHELVLFGGTLTAFKTAQLEWQKERYQIDTVIGVIRLLFLLAVGLWLFFRGDRLTAFWLSLRQKLR